MAIPTTCPVPRSADQAGGEAGRRRRVDPGSSCRLKARIEPPTTGQDHDHGEEAEDHAHDGPSVRVHETPETVPESRTPVRAGWVDIGGPARGSSSSCTRSMRVRPCRLACGGLTSLLRRTSMNARSSSPWWRSPWCGRRRRAALDASRRRTAGSRPILAPALPGRVATRGPGGRAAPARRRRRHTRPRGRAAPLRPRRRPPRARRAHRSRAGTSQRSTPSTAR